MKIGILFQIIVVSLLIFFTTDARSLESCDNITSSLQGLIDRIRFEVAYRAPANQISRIEKLEINSNDKPVFFPTARRYRDGQEVIIFPASFVKIFCNITFVRSLVLNDLSRWKNAILDTAKSEFYQCFDIKNDLPHCLNSYSDTLVKSSDVLLKASSKGEKVIAVNTVYTGLLQIAAHELSHITLNHADRQSRGTLRKIDAEFEADLYSVMWAITSGQAITYGPKFFFDSLTDIEEGLPSGWKNNSYERSICRADNLDRIAGAVDIIPRLLTLLANGAKSIGDEEFKDLFLKRRNNMLASNDLGSYIETCDKLGIEILKSLRNELLLLADLFLRNKNLFFNVNTNNNSVGLSGGKTEQISFFTDLIKLAKSSNVSTLFHGTLISQIYQRLEIDEHKSVQLIVPALNEFIVLKADIMTVGTILRTLARNALLPDLGDKTGRGAARGFLDDLGGLRFDPRNAQGWTLMMLIEWHEGRCLEALKLARKSYSLINKETRDARNLEFSINLLEKQAKEGTGLCHRKG